MIIEIICETCKVELSCTINAKDQIEVEMCSDCLKKEKKESFDEGYDEAE